MSEGWVLRRPDAQRAPFARALLPEVFTQPGIEAELWLLERERPPRVLGAAAWALATAPGGPIARCAARVIRPARGRGLGSRLLEHVTQRARTAGAASLETWSAVDDEETEVRAFLRRRGFAPVATSVRLRYRCAGAQALAALAPLIERMRRRARLPRHAAVQPLTPETIEPACRLVARELGGRAQVLLRQWLPRLEQGLSLAAFEAGRVVGVLLAEQTGERDAVVRARVSARSHRGRWPAPALLEAALRRGLERGLTHVEFGVEAQQHDTRRLARRFGAEQVGRALRYARPL